VPVEELAHGGNDLVEMTLEHEVPAIEEADFGVRSVGSEYFGTGLPGGAGCR
jgi:hypothetical protein